jgi:endonuclease/exonuclease/phosphatase (EEP) superfamily protein YafD
MTESKKSWKNLSFVGLVQVVAFFTIILSIFTLFNQHHRYLELFSHFKLQYLVASIACAVILALYKNYKFTVVLFVVAALNSVFIVPWYFSNSKYTFVNEQVDLTLLHSNVLTHNVEFEKFIDLVKQENPDLFVMQEVNQTWLSEIRELEKIYTYKYTIPREDNFGIALFSKYPFKSVNEVKSDTLEVPSIVATISIKQQLVTVITTHSLPPISNDYYHFRNSQINKIAELSGNHQGPLILIGDLNITMWSHDYRPLETETDLRNTRKGFGILPTWPSMYLLPIFMIPIDHVLISSHFVVHDIKVAKDIGSDHLPLIVKLGLISND